MFQIKHLYSTPNLLAPDGNEPIQIEAAREGLYPGVNAKGLLKEEEEEPNLTEDWVTGS